MTRSGRMRADDSGRRHRTGWGMCGRGEDAPVNKVRRRLRVNNSSWPVDHVRRQWLDRLGDLWKSDACCEYRGGMT